MNEGLIPRRYAKAFYGFAMERGESEKMYGLMKNLVGSFSEAESLQTIMSNPFISAADKVELLTTAANAGKENGTFAGFMSLLTENKRLGLARAIALAYIDIYRKANRIYPVEVVTASPLDTEDETRLKAVVLSHIGCGTMEYTHRVDPSLIGGFAISIGSERLDATISNELKQLRLKLLSN
ncbi:MAG: ATP synthase F1 subunit delta [Muribaculaceae bacterium]|nr:ATP synthase F1 subunit delta [Muribaculaceae bacterium]